jgi:MFS transporter, AAHS family, 4-hydroxybenzoate transporter
MFFILPESPYFLIRREQSPGSLATWLKRIDPNTSVADDARLVVSEERGRGVPIVNLFKDGRAVPTLLLWAIDFLNLLNLYFLSNWLPTIVKDAGHRAS